MLQQTTAITGRVVGKQANHNRLVVAIFAFQQVIAPTQLNQSDWLSGGCLRKAKKSLPG